MARDLTTFELALGAAYLLFAGGVSLALRLGLWRRLAWAGTRAVVQLLAVGYLLGAVFALRHPAVVLGLALLMIVAAARAAVGRSKRRTRGLHAATFGALLLVGLVTTLGATAVILRVDPWWKPQYAVPLLGMVLGNALTGISLTMDTLLEAFDERRASVEAELALGASRFEAARGPLREAVRRGLIPILNSMTVAGIVSLPGMMTGQILQGADPLVAVRYQILILFLIAGATALGAVLLGLWLAHRSFDGAHRLRPERIETLK